MAAQTFVIVGAGLAGAKAAESLRERGFDGRIVLLGEEGRRPYERPNLSKQYLLGEKPAEELYVHAEGWYADHDVDLRTDTTVVAIDPTSHEVRLAGGAAVGYDALLLATGAAPRRLAGPGADLPGVRTLRTMADSDRLRAAIRAAGRVVVVGASWIGCEVAAAARILGADVAMVAPEPLPLVGVLGPELGRVFRDLHAEHGVRLHLGAKVSAVVGGDRAEGVRTTGGEVIEGDLVVVGVGVSPRDELARTAGLAAENGVLVDEHLRSSVAEVFAAGDVANAWHPVLATRIRVEHWANALDQGPAAAAGMLGLDEPYVRLPYFYSDQYDLGMEYRGYAPPDVDADVVVRGDVAAREFLAFWLVGGRVVAGMNVNVWDAGDDVEALLAARHQVDPSRLADPDVPLADLL